MKLKAAAIALAAALTAAGPAAAEPLFATFQRLCVDTAGDATASLAAADAEGWMPLPRSLMDGLNKNEDFKLQDGRMRSDREGLSFMLHGGGSQRIGWDRLDVRMCALGALPGDAAELRQATADWVGVEPNARLSDDDEITYVFETTDTGRRAIEDPDDAAVKRLLKAGKVRMIFLKADEEKVLVAYGVPTL
ncbi:MAG: hypothetical protein WCY15_16385 [Phenylobacterium sp.]|uniref:hypothetical protein n=1 Tax=Phenylobacterium sp. TaxID=1871053 RepID=UPI002A35861B|nr:hypothetical protein [Phenylobacterium sp.]MDX9997007.1 hypothetical protein [Phenylobacterium sp.]